MLERLYTDVCEKARDAELRCLHAMTSFKDTMDDEEATTRSMPLVMQCFCVAPEFAAGALIPYYHRFSQTELFGFIFVTVQETRCSVNLV
jgi:hypothetical protein